MRLPGVRRRFRTVLAVDDFETIRSPGRKFPEAASFIVVVAGNGLKNSQACPDTAEKGRGKSTPPNAVYDGARMGRQFAGNGRRPAHRHRPAPDRMRCSIEHSDVQRCRVHESRTNQRSRGGAASCAPAFPCVVSAFVSARLSFLRSGPRPVCRRRHRSCLGSRCILCSRMYECHGFLRLDRLWLQRALRR